jgi:chaperonin GroEL
LELKQKAKTIKLKGPDLTVSIQDTMKTLSSIVGSTLGPGGNVVLLERPGLPPLVTKDGVTVIGHVAFTDATQHVISEAAKEVSQKTNIEAGDGTTTAIVLAESIVRHGMEYLEKNPGQSPQQVCRELNEVVTGLIEDLKEAAKPVVKEDLKKVALISANFDDEIADAVVEAIDQVGNDGTIITQEGTSRNTVVEMQEGYPINKGLSHLGAVQEIFINNPHDQEFVSGEEPLVLLYDGDLRIAGSLGEFLGKVIQNLDNPTTPILLFAHKFSPQVIQMCAVNFAQNRAYVVPLITPSTAQPSSKHHFLHDLASFTGADVLDGVTNTFDQADETSFGTVGRARIGRYNAYLFDSPEEDTVEERVAVLKDQMPRAESSYDGEIIKERIGALLGGIATIFVGGSSDLEIKEKKHRIEDAINATRSAIEMGVIPGGGSTLLCLSQKMQADKNLPPSAEILVSALAEPFVRIAKNAGESESSIGSAAQKVVSSRDKTTNLPKKVYDSFRHVFVNPQEAGILDPVKVTISALSNALSIAQMLMTIGGTIVIPRDDIEERQNELAAQNFAQQMSGV